jgi:hypothetical protein
MTDVLERIRAAQHHLQADGGVDRAFLADVLRLADAVIFHRTREAERWQALRAKIRPYGELEGRPAC